tara:strand:- start:126 stop:365 length:240 start_codon:yes stop_codon:yes gene_type:complete
MALSETVEYDKIEVFGQYKQVGVRQATVITKDGVEIARTFNRYVLSPDEDITNQPTEVQSICNLVWTQEIKDAWATTLA